MGSRSTLNIMDVLVPPVKQLAQLQSIEPDHYIGTGEKMDATLCSCSAESHEPPPHETHPLLILKTLADTQRANTYILKCMLKDPTSRGDMNLILR
jgi:hypothetical protein